MDENLIYDRTGIPIQWRDWIFLVNDGETPGYSSERK